MYKPLINKQDKGAGSQTDSATLRQSLQDADSQSVPVQARFGHSFERLPLAAPTGSSDVPETVQKQTDEDEELQMKAVPAIQRQDMDEDDELQLRADPAIQRQEIDEDDELQMKAGGPAPIQRAEPAGKANDTGLPDNLKAGVESLSGISLDNVKVHYNSSQPAQLNALAYAQGSDIHVAPGQEKHLPHEAWHVVQQAQGRVKPTMQMKDGVPVNDDEGLEHEADLMGAKALAPATHSTGEPEEERILHDTLAPTLSPNTSVSPRAQLRSDLADVSYRPAQAVVAQRRDPIQKLGAGDLPEVALQILGTASGDDPAEEIATVCGIPVSMVLMMVSATVAIPALVALLRKYKNGEQPELQPRKVWLLERLGSGKAAPNIVGELVTREWYRAESLTWDRKKMLLSLVANEADGLQRPVLARVIKDLAEHEGHIGEEVELLARMGPVLPEAEVDEEGSDEHDDVAQAPIKVKNQLAQLHETIDKGIKVRHFGQLDRIEQRIFAWFTRYKTKLDHPHRKEMFDYLDEVQKLHKKMTTYQIDKDMDLWTNPLGKGEDIGKIQSIWHSIMKGTDQFTFNTEVDKSFGKDVPIPEEVTNTLKVEIISELGRLMSRPEGRKLIGLFFEVDEPSVINFKLAQLHRIVAEDYVGDSAVPRNDGEITLSSSFHVAGGKKQVKPGRGQKSDVNVTPGKPDSLFLDYDSNFDRILSPGYIGLGHELIHAAHNLLGVSVGDWTLDGMPPEYHDLEEFVTIAPRSVLDKFRENMVSGGAYQETGGKLPKTVRFGKLLDYIKSVPTEADLRKEHGLDQRHEHITSLSDQTTKTKVPRKSISSDVVKKKLPEAMQELTI